MQLGSSFRVLPGALYSVPMTHFPKILLLCYLALFLYLLRHHGELGLPTWVDALLPLAAAITVLIGAIYWIRWACEP